MPLSPVEEKRNARDVYTYAGASPLRHFSDCCTAVQRSTSARFTPTNCWECRPTLAYECTSPNVGRDRRAETLQPFVTYVGYVIWTRRTKNFAPVKRRRYVQKDDFQLVKWDLGRGAKSAQLPSNTQRQQEKYTPRKRQKERSCKR